MLADSGKPSRQHRSRESRKKRHREEDVDCGWPAKGSASNVRKLLCPSISCCTAYAEMHGKSRNTISDSAKFHLTIPIFEQVSTRISRQFHPSDWLEKKANAEASQGNEKAKPDYSILQPTYLTQDHAPKYDEEDSDYFCTERSSESLALVHSDLVLVLWLARLSSEEGLQILHTGLQLGFLAYWRFLTNLI